MQLMAMKPGLLNTFAGANQPHAGDADKFKSQQDPGPRCFVMHASILAAK
jgi:hypothetical protein